MRNTLGVTDAEPDVLELLDDSDLDVVSGGLLIGNFGQFSLISANDQGVSFLSIGNFAILRVGAIDIE